VCRCKVVARDAEEATDIRIRVLPVAAVRCVQVGDLLVAGVEARGVEYAWLVCPAELALVLLVFTGMVAAVEVEPSVRPYDH